jgi:hypothetical protein
MSALWLQADGIRGGEKFDLPAVRPFLFSFRAETRSEAEDYGGGTRARAFLVHLWQIRGFLEAANHFCHRVFRL